MSHNSTPHYLFFSFLFSLSPLPLSDNFYYRPSVDKNKKAYVHSDNKWTRTPRIRLSSTELLRQNVMYTQY